ncbi:hypothetical protein H4219_004027 [Mycoemilia scoparia]|uniref:Uncharacterized protein n=1 Tax=Mycoemilia scoparia TaxID=417184 RepID=A0A9W8DM35_9FUNG|nr:hypothetical protein H4219_004027 [Mycoemilia scoparia]
MPPLQGASENKAHGNSLTWADRDPAGEGPKSFHETAPATSEGRTSTAVFSASEENRSDAQSASATKEQSDGVSNTEKSSHVQFESSEPVEDLAIQTKNLGSSSTPLGADDDDDASECLTYWNDEGTAPTTRRCSYVTNEYFPDHGQKKAWHLSKRHSAYKLSPVRWEAPTQELSGRSLLKDYSISESIVPKRISVSVTSPSFSRYEHHKTSDKGRDSGMSQAGQQLFSKRARSLTSTDSPALTKSTNRHGRQRQISTHSHISTTSAKTLTDNNPTKAQKTISNISSSIKRKISSGIKSIHRSLTFDSSKAK